MRKTTKIFSSGKITRIAGGKITERYQNYTVWSDTMTINAGGKIEITSDAEVIFGEYVPPEEVYTKHPQIERVEFLDENNTVLNQTTQDFFYGEKLKIRIITLNAKDGAILSSINLKAISKSKNQKFELLDTRRYSWNNLLIKDNQAETPYFRLNPNWYSDDFESYNYSTHQTEIKEEDLNEFFAEFFFDGKNVYLPLKGERLKPRAYKRNYEELVGLFSTDNSGNKDLLKNYENKFIDSNLEIKKIVDQFSEYLHEDNPQLTLPEIENRVSLDAAQLWKEAVWQNQGYILTKKDPKTEEQTQTKVEAVLDDRPLYWARNCMQVLLKRHPLFKKDINIEKSLVKKGTDLERIIQLFEEKSRNYTGINFTEAPAGAKKVLITGFDPFLLNSIDHMYKNSFNILQSNPSGVVALALPNGSIGNAFIQTMMIPVRYTDFDSSQEQNNGQGEGIIEKYIKPWINQVDMIITVSQYLPKENVIDMFSTSRRGGFNDNMDFIRENGSKALPTKYEWIETTLPKSLTQIPDIKLNWKYTDSNFKKHNTEGISPTKEEIILEGSGGDYLSNEIFYRVAKLRKEQRPSLATGHFHISKIQNRKQDLIQQDITNLIEIVKQTLTEGIK